MFYTIYQITNLLDGKIYIGKHQTKRLDDGYMGSGKVLRAAIKKYGSENFKKEILFVFDTEVEMNTKEAELVNEEFVGRSDTYNLCFGGYGGFGYINQEIWSSEKRSGLAHNTNKKRRDKISSDPVYKEAMAFVVRKVQMKGLARSWELFPQSAFYGKTHTEETKAKMRAANKQKGSQNSQFGTMWITNGSENRKIKKDLDSIPEGWYKGRKR